MHNYLYVSHAEEAETSISQFLHVNFCSLFSKNDQRALPSQNFCFALYICKKFRGYLTLFWKATGGRSKTFCNILDGTLIVFYRKIVH